MTNANQRAKPSDVILPHPAGRKPSGGIFENILVCVDGSAESECAVPMGIAIAVALGSRVTIMRSLETGAVGDKLPPPDALSWELARSGAARYLDELRQRLAARIRSPDGHVPAPAIDTRLEEGHAASRILATSRAIGADLIVLGRHGEHGRRSGSPSGTAVEVVARASCATLLVPDDCIGNVEPKRLEHVLVPLDGSQRGECALAAAVRLVGSFDAELELMYCLPPVELAGSAAPCAEDLELVQRLHERNRRVAQEYLAGLRTRLGGAREVRVSLHEEPLCDELCAPSPRPGADLVVMAAHGASGSSDRSLGSVAWQAIQHSPRPLLIVQDLSPVQMERCACAGVRRTRAPRVGNAHFQASQ